MKTSKNRKSVFVLCTGGTISMHQTAEGLVPSGRFLEDAMTKIPELQNPDMPSYVLKQYDNPIDSANMTPSHWVEMGKFILDNYDAHDGFVILHGTDSMAYSASVLSFMLENLNKPVILTGSQLPLFQTRNDARENLIDAMLLAGNCKIPEVCVYFNNKLFRGNRSKKMDASSFTAFASPNFPALGKIGTDVLIRRHLALETSPEKNFSQTNKLTLQEIYPQTLAALRVFPGISTDMLKNFLKKPLQALVLETYGLGTAPEDEKFLEIIRDAVANGIIIVNCSQCAIGKVKMGHYATGTGLLKAGVISGGDMTAEAALAKLYYLFSKKLPIEEIKLQMTKNLRGELT